VAVTGAGVSLLTDRPDGTCIGVLADKRTVSSPANSEEREEWRMGRGMVAVRVREQLVKEVAVGDVLCPSGAHDGTAAFHSASDLELLSTAEFAKVAVGAFAVVLSTRYEVGGMCQAGSDGAEQGQLRMPEGICLVSAMMIPQWSTSLNKQMAKRLERAAAEQAASRATAEEALARITALEQAFTAFKAQSEEAPGQRHSHGIRSCPSSAAVGSNGGTARPVPRYSSSGDGSDGSAMDCSDDASCTYCSQTDHEKEDCPSRVLVDLRQSGDKAPVRGGSGRSGSRSPRVGSKRSNSESSLADGRSMLTQSSPALWTGGKSSAITQKKKKAIATSAGGNGLRKSGNFMLLSDPRAKQMSSIIGLPERARIPISFPPACKELVTMLAGESQAGGPGIHVLSLAKTGRHTQEDVVSVLGCVGPNPIFKKLKLLFVWAGAGLPSAAVRFHIERLHPDHPSTLQVEGSDGELVCDVSFTLGEAQRTFPVTLKPDHPRKVGGHSALFDVEVFVDGQRVLAWNVQVYNSRYGPRLVHERPERTPYSRPPAVCTIAELAGKWVPSIAFLAPTNDVTPPPAKLRRTEVPPSVRPHLDSGRFPPASFQVPPRAASAPPTGPAAIATAAAAAAAGGTSPDGTPVTPSAAAQAEVERETEAEGPRVPQLLVNGVGGLSAPKQPTLRRRGSFLAGTAAAAAAAARDHAALSQRGTQQQQQEEGEAAAARKNSGGGEGGRFPTFSQVPGQQEANWRRAPLQSSSVPYANAESAPKRGSKGSTEDSLSAAAAAAAAAAAMAAKASNMVGSGRSGSQASGNSRMLGIRSSTDGMSYPRLVYGSLQSFGDDSSAEPLRQPPP